MSQRKIRLAVVGLGMASKPHLEALSDLTGQVDVSGVYNRSPQKAQDVAAKYGFKTFAAADEIAADPATDGVLLITPPDQRIEMVRLFAGAGKHILTEKPVERSYAAAREIVGICETAGVTLGVVFQHRFREAAERLFRAVRDGELGEIAAVRAQVPWWRPQSYYDVDGRGTFARDGGGVLISQAIHVLDFMLSLMGPAADVQAMTATTRLHRMETEDFAAGGIRFRSGAVGSVVATTATYPGEIESLVIDGTKANATVTGGQVVIRRHDGDSETIGEVSGTGGGADPMAFPSDWHRDLIANFAHAIATGGVPRITGRDALKVHALIEAFVASSREGRRVDVQGEPQ